MAKGNDHFDSDPVPSSRVENLKRTQRLSDTIPLVPASGTRRSTLVGRAALSVVIGMVLSCQPTLTGQSNSVKPSAVEQTFTEQRTLTGDSFVYSVAFAPDGNTLASGSVDNVVKLWNTRTGELRKTLTGDKRKNVDANSMAFAPDGKILASGSELWDTQTGALKRTLAGNGFGITSVAFAPDGKTLASGSWDKTVKLWDTKTYTLKLTLVGHTDAVFGVAFAPDGKTLASGSEDGMVKLWNTQTGVLERSLGSGADNPQSTRREAPPGALEKRLKLNPSGVLSVAFAADGKTLASGHKDGNVLLWDTQTGTLRRTLKGRGFIYSVVFAPDGKTLVSGADDNTVKLWDAQTGGLNQTLTGHGNSIISVAISPDGKTLASGSIDKTVKLWRVEP